MKGCPAPFPQHHWEQGSASAAAMGSAGVSRCLLFWRGSEPTGAQDFGETLEGFPLSVAKVQ